MEKCISDIPQVRPGAAEHSVDAYKQYVQLLWKPPEDCSLIKGSIGGYDVTLTGVSAWANMTQPRIIMSGREHDPSARIENLIQYTQYEASVFVKGGNGATNPALPLIVNFTTLPDGESYKM
jgi:hypothetical protein